MLDGNNLAILQKLKEKMDAEIPRKEGIVKSTDKGYGFLETDSNESFFIPPPEMKKVFHGDRILAKIITNNEGKTQAEPIELIEPFLSRNVAKIHIGKKKDYFVRIDNPNYNELIFAKIPNKIRELKLNENDWVIVELSDHPLKSINKNKSVLVKELIAHNDDPQIPWLVSLRKYDLPTKSPCLEQNESITLHDNIERTDLTHLTFVTIDSKETKDIDDALYIEENADNWLLFVAIADPTSYIEENSKLDKEAATRGFTCYLPGKNIPIIPIELSENECSLMENQERLTLVATIPVNKNTGSLTDISEIKFTQAKIKSKGKLSYSDVSDFLENKPNSEFKPSNEISNVLKMLYELSKKRTIYREKTVVLFKDKPDYHYILDEKGALVEIRKDTRRSANKIVEECMILANECAGKFLTSKVNIGIFNSHIGFDKNKHTIVKKILKKNNFDSESLDLFKLEDYTAIKKFANEQTTDYLELRLRKLQVPSETSATPKPHFGLGLECYATWTSPIRKYGDMINHRIIKSIINNKSIPSLITKDLLQNLNEKRKTNRYAERDVEDWLNIDYIYPYIENKTVFEAEIVDINRGGIKVSLIDNGITVFVPITEINPTKDPKITINQDEFRIYKEDSILYELAMVIKIIVIATEPKDRNILGKIID